MVLNKQFLFGKLSTTLIISSLLLAIGVTFLLFSMSKTVVLSSDLWLGRGVFKTKVALTQDARVKGLSGLNSMGSNEALIMAFPTDGKWGIWMKGMNFPLDIVWLDKEKRVIAIVKDVSPRESTTVVHQPKEMSRYVVEMPARTVDKMSIANRDVAVFQIDESRVK